MRTFWFRASLCAFAIAPAFASLPAWAKSEADCKQEYAAQKAAGATGGQSETSYVKACLAADSAGPAEGSDDVGGDTDQRGPSWDLSLTSGTM